MRLALLVAVVVTAAQPAFSLSCRAASVERSYADADASEAVYSVILGRFEFGPLTPPFGGEKGEGVSIPATFDGRVLGPDGFVTEVRRPLMLEIGCVSVWCGEIAPDAETLAFVEQSQDGLVIEVGPCPQWVFQGPTDEQIETVRACMTGDCE